MKQRPEGVAGFAGAGVACVAVSVVLFGVLHVVPPSAELDWSSRTISRYFRIRRTGRRPGRPPGGGGSPRPR